MNDAFTLKDMKERLKTVRETMKALEEVSGKIFNLKAAINDQQTKYNFLKQPEAYYKEFCKILNSDSELAEVQLDVRRQPPYYVHRRVSEVLGQRVKEIKHEKDRKFRTTLRDHVLFAIICDGKELEASPKKEKKDKKKGGDDDAEEVDWAAVNPKPDEEAKAAVTKVKRSKMFDEDGPFGRDTPLLIHRLLREQNHEYVFFADETGKEEVGVFFVLLDGLTYKV
jgi:hypothetical protein